MQSQSLDYPVNVEVILNPVVKLLLVKLSVLNTLIVVLVASFPPADANMFFQKSDYVAINRRKHWQLHCSDLLFVVK